MRWLVFILLLLGMDQAADHVTYRTLDRMIKQFAARAVATHR
jgi:hypothetical protein